MIAFPNAKINLGLHIVRKRPDGYHDLETCFYPVPWKDGLEIVEARETRVTTSGLDIPKDGGNIVMKAYRQLQSEFDLPPVHMHLHKVIPIGAGLGGGSSDAAHTLILLNQQFSLGLSTVTLKGHAANIGADCAFFIENKPSIATGIGEVLVKASISLQGKFLMLVYPAIHISTREAYASIVPKKPVESLGNILASGEISNWKDTLINDFEAPMLAKYPVLDEIRQRMYEAGAIYAAMSGSGSCMYGIFDGELTIPFPVHYHIWSGVV